MKIVGVRGKMGESVSVKIQGVIVRVMMELYRGSGRNMRTIIKVYRVSKKEEREKIETAHLKRRDSVTKVMTAFRSFG